MRRWGGLLGIGKSSRWEEVETLQRMVVMYTGSKGRVVCYPYLNTPAGSYLKGRTTGISLIWIPCREATWRVSRRVIPPFAFHAGRRLEEWQDEEQTAVSWLEILSLYQPDVVYVWPVQVGVSKSTVEYRSSNEGGEVAMRSEVLLAGTLRSRIGLWDREELWELEWNWDPGEELTDLPLFFAEG